MSLYEYEGPSPKPTKKTKRPGPDYFWNGREWVWMQRLNPVTGKPYGATTKPKPTGGSGRKPPGLTIDQWAQQQAEKYINAQVGAVEAQRKAYLDELARQAQLRVEQGNRLAQAMQAMGFDKRISGIYSNAGTDVAGMAQGFSGQTRNIANADAAQQLRMLSGTGQEGAVRNEGDAMGNVAYGVGGFLPGRSLGEQGAAFGADAALQPAFAMQQAASEAADIQEEGLGGLTEFANAIAEIRGGKMDLVEEYKAKRSEAANAEYERKFEYVKWQSDEAYRKAMYLQSVGKNKLAQQYFALAARKQKAYEAEMNRQYNLDVRESARQDAELEIKQNEPKGGKSSLTANQKASQYQSVGKAEEDITKAIQTLIANKQWHGADFVGPIPAAQRRRIENQLHAEFVQRLGITTTQAKKALRAAIRRLMKTTPSSGGGSTGGGGYDQYRP